MLRFQQLCGAQRPHPLLVVVNLCPRRFVSGPRIPALLDTGSLWSKHCSPIAAQHPNGFTQASACITNTCIFTVCNGTTRVAARLAFVQLHVSSVRSAVDAERQCYVGRKRCAAPTCTESLRDAGGAMPAIPPIRWETRAIPTRRAPYRRRRQTPQQPPQCGCTAAAGMPAQEGGEALIE
jgi:hypothetical protein